MPIKLIAPPPMRELKRVQQLDVSADATFDAWLREDGGRTLEEFCTYEWTNRPACLPPPPPLKRAGGVYIGELPDMPTPTLDMNPFPSSEVFR